MHFLKCFLKFENDISIDTLLVCYDERHLIYLKKKEGGPALPLGQQGMLKEARGEDKRRERERERDIMKYRDPSQREREARFFGKPDMRMGKESTT